MGSATKIHFRVFASAGYLRLYLYTPTLGSNYQMADKGGTMGSAPHKYSKIFHATLKLNAFFDYDEGMDYARKVHKPVMIDFTGHACVNCRKMEASVQLDKQVYERISQQYVLIQLYIDDKIDLAVSEQIKTEQGKSIKTIGNKWSNLQAEKFQTNSQPFYVLLNPENGQMLVNLEGVDYDATSYLKCFDSGLNAFKQTGPDQ